MTAQSFLPVSVYLDPLSFFVFLFLPQAFLFCFIFFFLSFPRLPAAYLCAVPAERKKSRVPADGSNGRQVQRKQRAPRPFEFPAGNYHGKYASYSFGRELSKYTHYPNFSQVQRKQTGLPGPCARGRTSQERKTSRVPAGSPCAGLPKNAHEQISKLQDHTSA
jgi:hypothetical protein